MHIEIHPVTAEDVEFVATHLREADRLELSLSRPAIAPPDTVREAAAISESCRVLRAGDEAVVIFGVVAARADPILHYGVPWMVASDRIAEIRKGFIEASRIEVEAMHARFPVLYNRVHRDNKVSMRWLRWLGFTIETTPTGPDNQFLNFSMEHDHV
ncbi:MAG: hypothetical protein ROZ37_04220 [Aromatoleum sp.]|jgi:hypothetical protein|uniref:hypothetical protein n=1 Tax=Aromatoleum sp. TaxID=2307007 RepID=UPI002895593E|nr:hypothetical protein [Aromatoleum sp.]MDT3669525.1 hypothetical protein [Aromatoleum sp.]